MSVVTIYSGKSTPAELLTNGIGILEATSCVVFEEVNGAYTVDITIPVGSVHSDAFVFGAIIRASTPKGYDYFQLDAPTVTLNELSDKAWQISSALGAPVVLNAYIDAKTGAQALPLILACSPEETRFTGTSDITTVNNMRTTQQSPLGALMNTAVDNCFLNRWGGEVERNKFIFNIKNRIGSDKGYQIALGKNLLGVTETPTGTGYTTRIIPKCLTADDTDLFLPETYINSPLPNPYDNLIHSKIYKCEGIKVGAVDSETGLIPYPTADSAYTKMRSIVSELYALGADVPGVTIDIVFQHLGDTEEYKQFKALLALDIQLGDTVHCTYFNRSLALRVSAYWWDSLGDKFIKLTIGDIAPNVAKSMYAQDVSLAALRSDMNQTIKQSEKYNNVYINHTDGFVAEATIGGKLIKTYMNATDGLKITVDGVKKFFVGTDGRVYATSIGNTPGYFAEIGIHDENGGGSGMDLFYNNDLFCSIDYLVDGGFALFDKNGARRIYCDLINSEVCDGAGKARISAYGDKTFIRSGGSADTYTVLDPTYQKVYIGGVLKQTL